MKDIIFNKIFPKGINEMQSNINTIKMLEQVSSWPESIL